MPALDEQESEYRNMAKLDNQKGHYNMK